MNKSDLVHKEELLNALMEKRAKQLEEFCRHPNEQPYYNGIIAGLIMAEELIIDTAPVNPAEEPTKKQIDFAKTIAKSLGIDLPKTYTKNAYRKFISDNISNYNTWKITNNISDEDYSEHGGLGIGFEHFMVD